MQYVMDVYILFIVSFMAKAHARKLNKSHTCCSCCEQCHAWREGTNVRAGMGAGVPRLVSAGRRGSGLARIQDREGEGGVEKW